jgi:carboxyl-terminal processing protease
MKIRIKRFDGETAVAMSAIIFAMLWLGIGVFLHFNSREKPLVHKKLNVSSMEISDMERVKAQEERFAKESAEGADLIKRVLAIINQNYYEGIEDPKKRLIYPAIEELVSQLDEHSYFLEPEEVEEIEERANGYEGVGLVFGYKESINEMTKNKNGVVGIDDLNLATIEIKEVFIDSPALKAGVKPGDQIIKVNNIPVQKIAAKEINAIPDSAGKFYERIKAMDGLFSNDSERSVALTVKRGKKIKNFKIKKEIIKEINAEYEVLKSKNGPFGYLRIYAFDSLINGTAALRTKKAVEKFKSKKVKGVIIDLRGNTGGFIDTCINILENFMPPNKIVITTKGKKTEETFYTSEFYADYLDLPIVILTDKDTISASEIVTGALRDYGKAIVIGRKTFGKGCTGISFDLADGSRLRLTNSKYFLPSGESIDKKGIKPHIEMDTTDDKKLIEKAEEVLTHWNYYKSQYLKDGIPNVQPELPPF